MTEHIVQLYYSYQLCHFLFGVEVLLMLLGTIFGLVFMLNSTREEVYPGMFLRTEAEATRNERIAIAMILTVIASIVALIITLYFYNCVVKVNILRLMSTTAEEIILPEVSKIYNTLKDAVCPK